MPPTNLRIAFFGSDLFSVASLKRLTELRRSDPSLISQLDVYTRSVKPTGRKMNTFVELPVGTYASKEKLPIYRVDTSEEIEVQAIPKTYDLAVAVSYGKLIPSKFLASLKYGGLNVHPSKLPQFSGSSPIQYALMEDCKTTAVTVQTLHPTKFDHGEIITQSSDIEILEKDNFASLQEKLSLEGARGLARVIQNGLFVDPPPFESSVGFSLAGKLTPTMNEVKWTEKTSREVCCLNKALGPLHTYKFIDILKKKKPVKGYYKVILDDIEELDPSDVPSTCTEPGDFFLNGDKLVVKTVDSFVGIKTLKFQYCGLESAAEFMKSLEKRAGDTSDRFLSSNLFDTHS